MKEEQRTGETIKDRSEKESKSREIQKMSRDRIHNERKKERKKEK